MATRLHFFTLVLVLLTTLSFIQVAPQTNAARLPKYMMKDLDQNQKGLRVSSGRGSYGTMKKYAGLQPRIIEEEEMIKKHGSRPHRLLHRGIKSSVASTPKTEGGPEDMRANPNPRVMGHGSYRIWRSQPSGMGEEENMEGREVIIPKRRHP